MIPARSLILLFLGLVLLYSLGNWTLPLIDRDEPRFAEASREMRQSGDFVIPRINGEYRFDKPPLIYWCQVISYDCFGENDFAARLPSVLFAAATACLTALWGSRLYGDRKGLWAGIVFGTTLQVFIHARAAVADMPMVFFFLAAAWIGWERIFLPESKRLWFGFYAAIALGFLAKGPVALLPMIVPPLHARLCRLPYRFNLITAAGGLAILLVIVGAWGVPALILTHGQFFDVGIGKHVVMRSIAPMESHGAPGLGGYLLFLPFYFVTLLISFLPWSLFFPRAFKAVRQRWESSDAYLVLHLVLLLIVFTLIRTKLPHYVLPIFPMLALLVARQIAEEKVARIVVVTATVFYLAVALAGFQSIEPAFPSKTIAAELHPLLTPEMRTASLGYDEQSLIWYLRSITKPFHERIEPPQFASFMNRPGPAVCVIERDQLFKVKIDPKWKSVETIGRNFARWHVQKVRVAGIALTIPVPQPIDLIAVVKQ